MRQRGLHSDIDPGPQQTREAVLKLQRSVQRRMEAEVRAHTGGNPPALERYYREYLHEFRLYQSVASYGELFQSMLAKDLLYIGDYHTLRQSQEVALRLLERAAAAADRPITLALEMVLEEHQGHLDDYMQGRTNDEEFRERIEYQRTWNFSWDNYRPLFEAARRLQVRVIGINHQARAGRGRIRQRDDRIADSIVSIIRQQPEARVLVLIGDLHLASKHLPRAVDAKLDTEDLKRQRLIVYQNSDTLYWNLVERGNERDTQVVRLGPDRYCVMEVPPFVKLQSYLSWEQAVERLDGHVEREDEHAGPTSSGMLESISNQLAQFFQLRQPAAHYEVYTNLDEHFFELLEHSSQLQDSRVREIRLLAAANRSCFIPELHIVYLPYFSVNHAAEEAMHILQAWHSESPLTHDSPYEDFYARTLRAAGGFLASRLVNPRRLATTEDELRKFVRGASRRLHEPRLAFRKLVARFVLQHKDHERARLAGGRGRLKQIYEQESEVVLEVTYELGYMLGEKLASALHEGHLSREEIQQLLFTSNDTSPQQLYFDIHKRLQTA